MYGGSGVVQGAKICHTDWAPMFVAMVAVAALAGLAFPSVLAADDAMTPEGYDTAMSKGDAAAPPAYARYDADSIDARVQSEVVEALMLYWNEGTAAFDMIIPEDVLYTDAIFPFILDADTLETVAHGAFPDRLGVIADTLDRADRPIGSIMSDLERDGSTWVEYMTTNPANGLVQPKRSYLYLYDGYIFGSGHYLPESMVKYTVEDAVQLYESKGQEAFDIITPEETLLTSELYPFIFNATTLKTVAHGAIPDRLGTHTLFHTEHRRQAGRGDHGRPGEGRGHVGRVRVYQPRHRDQAAQALLAVPVRRVHLQLRLLHPGLQDAVAGR